MTAEPVVRGGDVATIKEESAESPAHPVRLLSNQPPPFDVLAHRRPDDHRSIPSHSDPLRMGRDRIDGTRKGSPLIGAIGAAMHAQGAVHPQRPSGLIWGAAVAVLQPHSPPVAGPVNVYAFAEVIHSLEHEGDFTVRQVPAMSCPRTDLWRVA